MCDDACLVDYPEQLESARRGLHRVQVPQLAQGDWVSHHLNMLILGPTESATPASCRWL